MRIVSDSSTLFLTESHVSVGLLSHDVSHLAMVRQHLACLVHNDTVHNDIVFVHTDSALVHNDSIHVHSYIVYVHNYSVPVHKDTAHVHNDSAHACTQ